MTSRGTFLTLVLILGLTACGGPSSGGGPAGPRDTLVFAASADATTLDPHNTTDTESDQVIMMMYETLIGFDRDMRIVPRLAERWEVAPDGVTWTFHLRRGVRFHDGTPFNAEAVRRSFARVMDPVANHKRLVLFTMVDRVEAVDDTTVRIITRYPFGAFEPTMAHVSAAIVNPTVAERFGKDFGLGADRASGTGPYKITSWKKDQEIVLERFDGYWGEQGRTRRIVYRPIPEAAARVLALEAGDVDVVTRVPAADIARLETEDGIRVTKTPSVGMQQFRFNLARKPFGDRRVRQAISYAIDRRAIVDNLVSSFARPSTSALTPIMRGYVNLGEIPYDPDKARALLEAAGYPRGFKTRIATTPRYPMGVELAEAVAADLKKVGIDAAIDVLEWGTMVQFWAGLPPEKNPQEIFIMGAGASTADADWGLRPIFQTAPTNENNYGYYSNAEFDRVIEAAMRETEAAKRQQLYRRAQEIVYLEDPGAVWLFDTLYVVASRASVDGITPSPLGAVTFAGAVVNP
ncbi:MAG TPA: ABC transporter substrate-binding protein [Vicinamibacterales bacterium]|nr:ABC transporter substrate-binding protein [Vicinamibacterales bacterium]